MYVCIYIYIFMCVYIYIYIYIYISTINSPHEQLANSSMYLTSMNGNFPACSTCQAMEGVTE